MLRAELWIDYKWIVKLKLMKSCHVMSKQFLFYCFNYYYLFNVINRANDQTNCHPWEPNLAHGSCGCMYIHFTFTYGLALRTYAP
jgi:hypothetical protein